MSRVIRYSWNRESTSFTKTGSIQSTEGTLYITSLIFSIFNLEKTEKANKLCVYQFIMGASGAISVLLFFWLSCIVLRLFIIYPAIGIPLTLAVILGDVFFHVSLIVIFGLLTWYFAHATEKI